MLHSEGKHLKDKIVSKFDKVFRRKARPSKTDSATYFELPGSSRHPVNTSLYDVPPPGIRPVNPSGIQTQQPEREWFKQATAPEIWDTEETIDFVVDDLLDSNNEQEKLTSTALVGEFDPKNFLNDVPSVDTTGNELPPWKKMLIAKQMAEKEYQKAMEKKEKEQEDLKYNDMPMWKKVILQKRDNERNVPPGDDVENPGDDK